MFDGWRQLAGRWSHAIDVRSRRCTAAISRRTLRSAACRAGTRLRSPRDGPRRGGVPERGMRGLLTMSGALVADPIRARAALFA